MKLAQSKKIWEKQSQFILPTNEFIQPVINKGFGSFVWDVDDNKYLDINCGQFCLCFGHSYEPFIKAILKQLKIITHTNTNTLTKVVFQAFQSLSNITDNNFKSGILLSTGAEAVEFSLRFLKSIKKNEKVIFFNQGYHGLSLGSQSISTFGKWAFPNVDGTYGISVPCNKTQIDNSIHEIETIIEKNPSGIAGIVMEPILGAGGMIFPPKEFFKKIRSICDKNGIILVFDECQTGFGRTGNWFQYQNIEVIPDILIFAKAGGAGFPVSGVMFNDRLVDGMRSGNLTHFSSHQNDPLAAAVLLFVIEEIKRKKVLNRVKQYGAILLQKLKDIAKESDVLINPRGNGLMIAFDLNEKLFLGDDNPGKKLIKTLLEYGIIIQCINRGRTFRVMPNYFIKMSEINFFIKNLKKVLKVINCE